MENQALGLAEAMGLSPRIVRLTQPAGWAAIPPQVGFLADAVLRQSTPLLGPPWPDLLIACGRRVILPTRAIARRSGGKTRTVYLQDPRIAPQAFDRVVVPAHDRLRGPNVLVTLGALHRLSPRRLAEAAADAPPPPTGNGPVLAVLIGGRSKGFDFTASDADTLAANLQRLQAESGVRLLVTTSRRTGAAIAARLAATLAGPATRFWSPDDPTAGPNPLFAFLHHADAVLVTGDSVSMMSEACSLNRPVGIVPMRPRGRAARKIESFRQDLIAKGAATAFDGSFPQPPRLVLNEPQRIADELWQYLEKSES